MKKVQVAHKMVNKSKGNNLWLYVANMVIVYLRLDTLHSYILKSFSYGNKEDPHLIPSFLSVHDTLRSLSRTISTERERLKYAIEQERSSSLPPGPHSQVASLKQALAEVWK